MSLLPKTSTAAAFPNYHSPLSTVLLPCGEPLLSLQHSDQTAQLWLFIEDEHAVDMRDMEDSYSQTPLELSLSGSHRLRRGQKYFCFYQATGQTTECGYKQTLAFSFLTSDCRVGNGPFMNPE